MNDQPTQLTTESFNAIAAAFGRLQQLGDSKIATGAGDTTQQEREQLLEFLATELLKHAGEFIACYDLTHREYLPACNALLKIAKRCGYFPTPAPTPFKPDNN